MPSQAGRALLGSLRAGNEPLVLGIARRCRSITHERLRVNTTSHPELSVNRGRDLRIRDKCTSSRPHRRMTGRDQAVWMLRTSGTPFERR